MKKLKGVRRCLDADMAATPREMRKGLLAACERMMLLQTGRTKIWKEQKKNDQPFQIQTESIPNHRLQVMARELAEPDEPNVGRVAINPSHKSANN